MSTLDAIDPILKLLRDRENDLEKKRTTSLARQLWPRVIDIEARLDEITLIRHKVMELTTSHATNAPATRTPIS